MRILFVHNKAPKPFRYIAQEFASSPNNKVLYLSEQCSKEHKIPKVRHIGLPKARVHVRTRNDDFAFIEIQTALQRASTTANALLRLKKSGFIPDIIYTTPLGGSLYIKDIYPEAFLVVQANWFYTMNENFNFFCKGKTRLPIQFAPARMRNLFQFNALNDCNLSITSTEWQKQQYPESLRNQIVVSSEGIDTDLFAPDESDLLKEINLNLEPNSNLVTFISKNAEPYSGFEQFINCIPTLLNLDPKCHILICGVEREYLKKQIMLANVNNKYKHQDLNRIHARQSLSPQSYRQVLKASSVHVYLTAPYALSSSLLEALSCGCLVVGSDTAPVQEIIKHGQNGFLSDFWDSNALAHTIAGILSRIEQLQPIKENARNTALNNYNKQTQTKHHMELISKMLSSHNKK